MTHTFRSKFPDTGTTIFTVMSALANQHGAINLSQGFPDYPANESMLGALAEAAESGHNQYAPMTGLASLRQAISAKLAAQHGLAIDPDASITITAGATQAIFTALCTVLQAGDEAILFDPSYDCYAPAIIAQGANPIHIALAAPEFAIDWTQVERSVTPRTRAILINNPNNPATTVMSRADLDELARIAERHNLIVISDEVYEHVVFGDEPHQSVLNHPGLSERAFAIYSFGKTFHVTGWKVGYCVAPADLTAEFRKIHQFLVFSVNTPAQHAIATHLAEPAHWRGLPGFFEPRRQMLAEGLTQAGFRLLACHGTYFQLADYSALRDDLDDTEFARWLTVERGVACIPISAFYRNPPSGQRLVRFCFAKREETLRESIHRLNAHPNAQ